MDSNLIFSENQDKVYSSDDNINNYSNHNSKQIDNYNKELNEIFEKILIESNSLEDSSFYCEKSLCLFIRKYRIYMKEILNKISVFFSENAISCRVMAKCIIEINTLFTEKNNIINLGYIFIPLFIKKITQSKIEKISSLKKINHCIDLLNSKIYLFNKKYLENLINDLLQTLLTDKNLNDNNIYAIIHLLSKFMNKFTLFLFNKILSKVGRNKFLNVLNFFSHNNKEIRLIVGEAVSSFLHLLINRDVETKYYFINDVYKKVSEEYLSNLKECGDIPGNYNILSGYLIVLKQIINFYPIFLKKIYVKLVDDLFKCKNSNKSEIKIEFIKFFPELYSVNKNIFITKYIKPFLEYINSLLDIKTEIEIRNQILLSLGKLSQIIKAEVFNISKNSLISFIHLLMKHNSLDDEVFKCLADLINNKDKIYVKEIFENFSVYIMLPKLFENPLSTNKIEYILSIFKYFDNNTSENIFTTIISLNVISLYICNEEMKLDNFNQYTEKNSIDIEEAKIAELLQNIKIELKKIQEKNLNDFDNNEEYKKFLPESDKIKNINEIFLNALTLLSHISNDLFYKDMFIFYSEKLMKLLSSAPNKLYKKIIELLLCKFIKKYPEDLNFSEFLLNQILTSIRNIVKSKKSKLKELTFNIIIKKDVFLDVIWKDKYNFMLEINGMLKSNEEKNIKKKLVELACKLLFKYNDKNYCSVFTQNTVISFIFQLHHSYDLIEIENLSFNLLFFTEFFKKYYNTYLIEKILKVIVYLIISKNYKGILIINMVKILKELLISGIIKEKYSDLISDLLNILYALCLLLLKERIIDDPKLDLLIEVIYQIIKTLNINIYAKYILREHLSSSFLFLLDKNKFETTPSNNQLSKLEIEKQVLEIIEDTNHPNILELLFMKILDTENSKNIFIIMKIFGLCGAMYTPIMKLLFKENNLNSNILLGNKTQQLTAESDDLEITIYNSKLRQYETINFSSVEPSSFAAVSFIIEIIKRDTYPELTKNLISHLYELIENIEDSQSDLIFLILPTIIKIITKNCYEEQKKLFCCIYLMMSNFKDKCSYYLADIIQLIINFFVPDYIDVNYKLLNIIFENYIDGAKNYFSIIIPKIFCNIKNNSSNIYNDINLFIIIFRKSNDNNFITPYLRLLIEEIMSLYLENINEVLTYSFLTLFYEMTELSNIYIFYHLIIKILLKKIKILCDFKYYRVVDNNEKIETKTQYLEYVFKSGPCSKINNYIITKSIDIFSKMNKYQRNHFIPFGLSIVNTFKNIGLLDFLKLRKKFIFLIIGSYDISLLNKNSSCVNHKFCRFNCIDGVIINYKEKKMKINKSNNNLKKDISLIVNKKDIDPNIIINLLNNSNFTNKDNWNEMQSYFSNIIFEQTPSYFLYCCNLAYDYYGFAIMEDLINYCIYSIYINISDDKKLLLSKSMKNIIMNNNASENIKLLILNLKEFVERKNFDINILDHELFGKISNNCHSYAKALYYIENDFLNKNNQENYEKLIELYNNLGSNREAGMGLIKFAEKMKMSVTYKNYLNIKCYEHALKLIQEELANEKDETTIKELENNKRLCQFCLYNWEELLNEDECIINNLKNKTELMDESENSDFFNKEKDYNFSNNSSFSDNYSQKNMSNIRDKIEKEIILSKASINLCKWDQLDKHVAKIKMIFINNLDEDINILNSQNQNVNDYHELDENIINDENNILNKTIANNVNKKYNNKEKFLILSPETQSFNSTIDHIKNYLPFNELVYKYDNLNYLINDNGQLYYINLFSSIINLIDKNYDVSEKYLCDARKIIFNKIKPLLNESYERSFELFLKNQQLHFIEDIINYEKYHLGDKEYLNELKKSWDKIYSLSIAKPIDKRRLLIFYNLLFPIEEIYDKYIQISKSCREFNYLKQSESILKYVKNKIELNKENIDTILFNEINIKIDLNLCKCLFEKGETDFPFKKMEYLIEILEEKKNTVNWKISDNLKSKIYGNYANYSLKRKIIFNNNLRKIIIKKNSTIKEDFAINYPCYLKDLKNFKHQIFPILAEIDKINNCFNLALKYNPNKTKLWNNYSLFSYKCYKFFRDYKIDLLNLSKQSLNEKESRQEITFAINTIKAIKNCLLLSGKQSYEYIDNAIRLLDIFINSAEVNDNLLSLIKNIFDDIYIKPFTFFFVQLEAVIKSENTKVLEVFENFLTKIILNDDWFLIAWYIPLFYSKEEKFRSYLKQVFYNVKKIDPFKNDLINAYLNFIYELNKCALLLHEEWKEVIELSAELMYNKNYGELVYHLLEMHKKMKAPPESMNEIHFHQKYRNELREAEKYLQKYINTKNTNYIKEGWEIYMSVYINIRKTYKHLEKISLEYIAPKLVNITKICSKIYIPGQILPGIVNEQINEKFYTKNKFAINNNIRNLIYLKKINNILNVFKTKHQPKRIAFIGTDDKEYKFLLKGHEDLRQDNRLVQLFILVNSFLLKEKKNKNYDLYIKNYMVIPFSKNTGIIGWVNNSDSIYNLIVEYRKKNNLNYNMENEEILKAYPKFATGNLLSKVEIFKEVTDNIPGIDLRRIIWLKSKNCESWLFRRTNYSRSLAVMSMVGYIVGLGDRHPNNLLMERDTGKIVHIDFGDCFEVAMKRKNFPEKIPFRLTRMFVNALEVSGIEGTFRITCEYIMELMRRNKDTLIVLLNYFVYDPSFAWKLWMIMHIKKKEINEKNYKKNSVNTFNAEINLNSINTNSFKENMKCKLDKLLNSYTQKSERESILSPRKEKNKKQEDEKINIFDELKEERQKVENEHKLLATIHYKNVDVKKIDELYNISKMIIKRMIDKLTGSDFELDKQMNVKDQVDRLINQAILTENIVQSYLGWCPYW